jgi:hypothetical protein
MKSLNLSCKLALCAVLLSLGQAAFGAFDEPGKVLFTDSFESLKTEKGVLHTEPVSSKEWGGRITSVLSGGAGKLVEGKKGRALQLTGDSRVTYSNFDAINLLGGEASFWVRLDFDPNAKNERTTTGNLRNQFLLSFFASDHSIFEIYTCLHDVSIAVTNPDQNFVLTASTPLVWKQGEWRQIKIVWGNALELWVDGDKKLTQVWDGLFGPLPTPKDNLSAFVGYYWSGMHSEFTMDELTVQGPRPGNLAGRPRMAVPLLDGAPTLDGKLDDPFWQQAGMTTGFCGMSKRELDRDQPAFLAAYTTAGLYFGARIPLPDGRRPSAMMTAHNSGVYSEDSIELLLQPTRSSPAFYHFAANAIGTKAEVQWSEAGVPVKGYDPEWQVATSSKDGEWIAEAFIPYKALGLNGPPKAGDVWGANFVADSSTGQGNARTWAFTEGNFVQPITFGELLMMGKARTLREESFTGFAEGNPSIRLDIAGGLVPTVTANAEFFDKTGKSVRNVNVHMNDNPSAVIGAQFLQAGIYTARLSAVDDAKTELFRQVVIFKAVNAFGLQVENYPYAGVAEARAGLSALKAKPGKVTFQLLSSKGEALDAKDVTQFERGAALAKFDNTKLEPGEYTVQATAYDAQGKSLDSAKQALKIFPRPTWWKNTLGFEHSVPAPWKPVKATAKGFEVWGRDYQFEKSAFPLQIVNQGKPMFKAAPKLLLRAGGKETDLLATPRQSATPDGSDQVELSAASDAGGVAVRAKGTLEFDGCFRFDLELSPGAVKSVDGLVLELTLPREIGQALLSSNGASCSITELKSEHKAGFVPYIWVGNDDMGLAFFSDSDQYWSPRDSGAIQIVPSAETTLVRINVIRAPLALKKPISYAFGLMASPVRPIIDGDPFVWMLWEGDGENGYGVYVPHTEYSFSECLTYPAEGAFSAAEGTLEFWARRTKEGTNAVEVFHVAASDPKIGIVSCSLSSALLVDVNGMRLLTGAVNLSATEFSHVALVWNAKTVALYVNGSCAATGTSTDVFRKILESAGTPSGKLVFGCLSEWKGQTAIEVDDIRLSAKARYEGDHCAVPTAALQKDADTRLLDALDETFIPDGQDALTAAGGQPSIGCRFVAGKFGRALCIEVGPPRTADEIIQDLNAKVGLAWAWNFDYSKTGWPPMLFVENRPNLKTQVEDFHRHHIRILPYMAYPAIGAPSELADQWGSEWEIKPISIYPMPPPEGHVTLNSSLSARGFADYLTAGAVRLMDDFGLDGIYTDGINNISASQNLYAGAGYVDEDGALRSTVPIWGTREALKRLYRTVKAHKPDGLVMNHCSFDTLIPTLSFSDIWYTGEGEDYENLLNARYRFSSRPWGIQATVLGHGVYSPPYELAALLVGTSNFGQGILGRGDEARKWINLRKAYLAFGYKTAEWVPFFKNRDTFYAAEDPKTKVSLYYHPGKDAFLIVGNTDAQVKTVNVQLHLKAFGLEGAALRARNALTQVPAVLTPDGKLTVPVRAKSFVLVAVERNP